MQEAKMNARGNYYNQKFSNNQDQKRTWQNLNGILGRNKSATTMSKIKTESDETITDATQIADIWNHYLIEKSEELARQCSENIAQATNHQIKYKNRNNVSNSFVLLPTDESEIKALVSKFAPKKNQSFDKLSMYLIKNCIDALSRPIAALVNKCFLSGEYPDIFKTAKIIPIYKSGSKNDLSPCCHQSIK